MDDEDNETKQRQIVFIDMEIQLTPEEKKERDHNNYIRRKTMKNIDGKSLKVHKHIMQRIKRR